MQACCSAESRGKLGEVARRYQVRRAVLVHGRDVEDRQEVDMGQARRSRGPGGDCMPSAAVVRVNAAYVPRSAAGTVASLMEKSRTWSS